MKVEVLGLEFWVRGWLVDDSNHCVLTVDAESGFGGRRDGEIEASRFGVLSGC